MKIARLTIYRYELPLKRPVTANDEKTRRGVLIALQTEHGHKGWGEVAPLPDYSRESLGDALEESRRLRHRVLRAKLPGHLEELSGGFERWVGDLGLCPSVRFGFESAVLSLLAGDRGVPVRELLAEKPARRVVVNGLVDGDLEGVVDRLSELRVAGYRSVKLKVGRRAVQDDIDLVRRIAAEAGDTVRLRLDANRSWSPETANHFCDSISDVPIDYLEEPLADPLDLPNLAERTGTPIALDESLVDMDPGGLTRLEGITAVVLKPTMLGLERSVLFARTARSLGMTAVFTSTFESTVGLGTIAQLAAALLPAGVPCGLDTAGWFQQDLVQPMEIVDGEIDLAAADRHPLTPRPERLQDINHE